MGRKKGGSSRGAERKTKGEKGVALRADRLPRGQTRLYPVTKAVTRISGKLFSTPFPANAPAPAAAVTVAVVPIVRSSFEKTLLITRARST